MLQKIVKNCTLKIQASNGYFFSHYEGRKDNNGVHSLVKSITPFALCS